jgi:hypothetical protein
MAQTFFGFFENKHVPQILVIGGLTVIILSMILKVFNINASEFTNLGITLVELGVLMQVIYFVFLILSHSNLSR